MSDGRFISGLRGLWPTTPVLPVCSALLVLALTSSVAKAEVEVDLSGIGLRSTTDERIEPGRAPVQLRPPQSAPEALIELTPPPGVDPAIAPTVIAPTNSQTIKPVVLTPTTPMARPTRQATLPDPADIAPAPLLPVVRAPAPQTTPDQTTGIEPAQPAETPALTEPASRSAPETAPTANVQTASLPAPAPASHHLRFDAADAAIPVGTRSELELIAAELMRHSDRIEIQAYAGVPSGLSSEARRLSLKRGLAVRKFLVDQGVLQSRIDVRALGGVRDNGPTERVDIVLSRR